MSATPELDTVETRTERPDLSPRVFDVSDVPPASVTEYAAETDADCYFERRPGRTYLVAR